PRSLLPRAERRLPCFLPLNAAATPDTDTLSLHDALPILVDQQRGALVGEDPGGLASHFGRVVGDPRIQGLAAGDGVRQRQGPVRSEEHTSELQSRFDLVCRLLLEKKKIPESATRHARKHS